MKKKIIIIIIIFLIPILLWLFIAYFFIKPVSKNEEKFVVHKYINKFNNNKIYYILVNDFNDTFAELNEIDDFRIQFLNNKKGETGYIYFLKSFGGLESRLHDEINFYSSDEIDDLIVAYFYEGECIVEIYYK